MKPNTLEYLKCRTAELAIDTSTLRNQGAAGVVQAARGFLANVDLKSFSVHSAQEFFEVLDGATDALAQSLPEGARHWGTARKALNIFLRDCVYNRFLCSHFAISCIHRWLEVPLDSYVATGLQATSCGEKLPRWRTIRDLKQKDSDEYQRVATKVANRMGCNRVDLDVYLWRGLGIEDVRNV
jgi:hypothetical protein